MFELDISSKGEAFVPVEPAAESLLSNIAAEFASWIGERVCILMPGTQGVSDLSETLTNIINSQNGDVIFKIERRDTWGNPHGYDERSDVPTIHLIPLSQTYKVSLCDTP